MASSSSSSSSSSTSSPVVMNTPASDFSLSLAQALGQIGQQQYQWAQQVYGQTSDITDQQIQNFLQQTQQASDLAGNVLGRYESQYAPAEDQYARDAQSYASEGRMSHEMGAAESRASQAGQQARANAEQELQSFGIDPSSGRYQDLIRASRTADAASAASAGETARRNVEEAGNQRKQFAIATGQQLPGAGVNAVNAAYQGISGAENAALGRANTGVNLMDSANPYFQTAMSNKFPPVGQNTRSQSQQQGHSSSPDAPGSGRGQGGGGGPGGGGGGMIPAGNYPGAFGGQPSQQGGPSGGGNGGRGFGGAGIQGVGGAPGPDAGYDPNAATSGASSAYRDNGYQSDWDPNAGQGGSTSDMWGSAPYWTGGQGNTQGAWGDSGQAASGPFDYDTSQWDAGGQDVGGWDTSALNTNWGSSPQASWPDSGASSGTGWDDQGNGDYGSFAGGGAIPSSMSPSGGQQTDDVAATIPQTGGRAQLNVDEFVIPKDVAMWKGQEFFQKLIMQSRAARTGAPAKPKMGP